MEHTQWSHLPLLVSLLIYYHIPIQVQTDHKGSDHKNLSSVLHKALEGAIIFETFPKTIMDVFALVLESMSILKCSVQRKIHAFLIYTSQKLKIILTKKKKVKDQEELMKEAVSILQASLSFYSTIQASHVSPPWFGIAMVEGNKHKGSVISAKSLILTTLREAASDV